MSVDIVNLIESNPITKLNGNYQSKLIAKVKNNFTDYEQQIFLASFYCYLKYDYKNDFVIDLDNVWQWLGFGQKVNAKRVLEKNFTINIDYKLLLCQPAKQTTNTKGGHNKETFMLNIKTFKLFCIKAETKKADEIHEYFVKLEEILQEVLLEESNELKLQLEQQKTEMQLLEDKKKLEYETKLEKQKILEREKILLKEYGTIGAIVYIIKVKTYENGQYVVKIGESRKGIKNRYVEHKSKFEECLLLDCFAVQNSKDFESFIHNHENIRLNKFKDLQGHETELELFLIGKHLSYKTLLNIIDNNIKYFNGNDSKLLLENEQLKLMLEMKNSNNDNLLIQELIKMVKQLTNKIDALEKLNKAVIDKLNYQETKITTGFSEPLSTVGPRLQKINPETMQLIKVYESVSELMKEDSNIKRPSINKAVIESTIYCGYRWLLVDRDLDPNVIHNISPTKQTKTQNTGYLAQLSKDKKEITNVYLDRKTAAHCNGYESSSALDNPVKNFTLAKEFYYKLYDECDLNLREIFEEVNGEPLLYKNGIGQFDLKNNLIREFSCKYDCIKTLSMSDKTLAKALEKQMPYNGFYFKDIGSKVKCL
jgi:phage anti-repressor protein